MGHSSTTFLLLAGLSQVQGGVHTVMDKQSDFSRWLPSKFCAGEGEVLQRYKFLGALWILFLSSSLTRHIICLIDGNVTTNVQVQCGCTSGGRAYGPYLTQLSLQHWDMHTLQISYRNLDKLGWCSFRARAESHTLLDRAIIPREWSSCVPRN